MAGPKPAALPLGDCPTNSGGEGGIWTHGELLTHTRLAGVHLKPARSPLHLKNTIFTGGGWGTRTPMGKTRRFSRPLPYQLGLILPLYFILEIFIRGFCQALSCQFKKVWKLYLYGKGEECLLFFITFLPKRNLTDHCFFLDSKNKHRIKGKYE